MLEHNHLYKIVCISYPCLWFCQLIFVFWQTFLFFDHWSSPLPVVLFDFVVVFHISVPLLVVVDIVVVNYFSFFCFCSWFYSLSFNVIVICPLYKIIIIKKTVTDTVMYCMCSYLLIKLDPKISLLKQNSTYKIPFPLIIPPDFINKIITLLHVLPDISLLHQIKISNSF